MPPPLLPSQGDAPVDLCEPGDSRPHLEATPRPLWHLLVCAQQTGPRPDHAHVALQHIDYLGQFVDLPASQEATERHDVRVSRARLRNDPTGVRVHCPKFVDAELAPIPAHPLLREECRARRSEAHTERSGHDDRTAQHQDGHAASDVTNALKEVPVHSGWMPITDAPATAFVQALLRGFPRADLDRSDRAPTVTQPHSRVRAIHDRVVGVPARAQPLRDQSDSR